jgi:hypothetical protein
MYPPEEDWVVARSYQDAVDTIRLWGLPEYIGFDHDLGEEKTGYDFAKWLVDYHIQNHLQWKIDYWVHSQNPVGKKNIEDLIEGFKTRMIAIDNMNSTVRRERDVTPKIDDGGTAFPSGLYNGMTLRDYFAGQALISMGAWTPQFISFLDTDEALNARAEWAYRQADAMIAASKTS